MASAGSGPYHIRIETTIATTAVQLLDAALADTRKSAWWLCANWSTGDGMVWCRDQPSIIPAGAKSP